MCLALLLGLPAAHLAAATSERIVTDRFTGLAIYGYDPVAYFTDQKPVPGIGPFELRFEGLIWRFRNDGNRQAFAANPEIYLPRYGGYDPIAIARGVALAGNPLIWVMSGDRTFFFYDVKSQRAFAASAPEAIVAADARWPEVLAGLSP